MINPIFWWLVLVIIIVVAFKFLKELTWIPKAFYEFFALIYKLVKPESGPAKIATAFVSILFGFLIIWLAGGFIGLFAPIWSNLLGLFLAVGAMVFALCLVMLGKSYFRERAPDKGILNDGDSTTLQQSNESKTEPRSRPAYFCQNCKKEYVYDETVEWRIRQHKHDHHYNPPDGMMSIECKECKAWFCSSHDCVTLLLETGKCPICGHRFSSKEMKSLDGIPQWPTRSSVD